jgi:hypothetical protein
MLPQHGGVPNFRLRVPGPLLVLLALVLGTGLMLTLSFHLHADPGDIAAQSRVKLSLTITLLLSAFILLTGMSRWLHPHLWNCTGGRRRHGRSRRRSGYSSRSR